MFLQLSHDYNGPSYRRAALEKWKQYHGSSATYRNLTAAFEQAGHKDFADNVHKIAGEFSYKEIATFATLI